MTDGGDWVSRGRLGPDDFEADDPRHAREVYEPGADWPGREHEAAHGWTGEFERPGYGRPEPAEGYGDPYYQSRQGGPSGYGEGGYGDAGYGEGGYGEAGYGEAGYGEAARGGSGGYSPGEYGEVGGYGRQPGYEEPGGYWSGGQGPGATGAPYSDQAYRSGDYGRGIEGPVVPYGREPYGEDPYGGHAPYHDQDSTSAYDWPGQHQGEGVPPGQPYGQGGGPGGHDSFDGTGSFGRADTGSLGRADSGSFGAPGGGSFDGTGSFGRADSGSSGRADSGSSGRADSGSFGRADTGSLGRADSGSLGRADSGSFGAPGGSYDGTGSFGRADSGSFGRGQISPPPRAALPAGPDGGYAQWQSEPGEQHGWDGEHGDGEDQGDDAWGDEVDDGPVSRLLSRGGRSGGRSRAVRRRRLSGRFALIAAILAGALVLGMGADFGYEYVHHWITNRYGNYSGPGYGTVRVTVPAGSSLSGLGPMLVSDGVIMALRPYDTAANAAQNASTLQPGLYLLHNHMNASLAVAALLNPKKYRIKDQITIIEGWRASQIAAALAKQTGDPASQFKQLIEHPPASLGLPKWASGRSAEGFLFPDTYTLLPHMSALAILQAMVKDFNQRTAGLNLAAAAPKVFTTPYHIMVVASLIQAEAGSTSDFPKISRVIWNRLRTGMRLQLDSTIFYAMDKYGTAVTKAQEGFASPYNTYLHAGLPPGPIDSPSLLAIQAALHPVDGPTWLYFITDTRHKPYKTHFTSSLAQLQQWQQQFQG